MIGSPALRHPKSLWSYNPIPGSCVLYLPFWYPGLSGTLFNAPDFFGSACTVSGALYKGDDGRWFDGGGAADDFLKVTEQTATTDIFTGGGTIIAMINIASDGENDNGFICRKGSGFNFSQSAELGGAVKLEFTKNFDVLPGRWVTDATDITINTWTMVAVTYDDGNVANNPTLYIDDTARTVGDGLTETQIPNATTVSDSGSDTFIGSNADPSIRTIDGYIGELYFYKGRILSAAELAYARSRIIGRYS